MEKPNETNDTKKPWFTSLTKGNPYWGALIVFLLVGAVAITVLLVSHFTKLEQPQKQGAEQELIEILGQQDEIINRRDAEIVEQEQQITQLEKTLDSLKKENQLYKDMAKATRKTYEQSLTNYRKKPKSVPIVGDALGDTIAKLKAKYGLR